MPTVQVIQRHAHLASDVLLGSVNTRDGKVAKAVLTAISNTYRGSGESREEAATAIQWTLWGQLAENAAKYLRKGSHVNVVGRVQNNNYDKDGQTVYGMTFTAEEIDYLNTRVESDALRSRGEGGDGRSNPANGSSEAAASGSASRTPKPRAAR